MYGNGQLSLNDRFSIYQNHSQTIILYEDKLYELESSHTEIILNDLGLGFELYSFPITVLFDNNDVYVAGEWVDEKYNVETCMYTFTLN